MSQGASAELPKHPVRPLPPDPSKLLLIRRMGLLGVQTKTSLEDHSESEASSPQAAAPLPVPAQRTVFLLQPTETEGASPGCNNHPARPPPPDPLKLQSLRCASQDASPICLERPARPPPPDPLKIQSLRRSRPPDSLKAVSPPGLPSPVLRSFLPQTTETRDLNDHTDECWDKSNGEATASIFQCGDPDERPTDHTTPLCLPQLSSEEPVEHLYESVEGKPPEGGDGDGARSKRSLYAALAKTYARVQMASGVSLGRPARPLPPDHSKIRHLKRPDTAELRTEPWNPSPEGQDVPVYVCVLPESSHAQDLNNHAVASSVNEVNSEAKAAEVLYEVLDESRITDRTTPPKPPPPPLPPFRHRTPFLSLSTLEKPVEHVYESIDDVLSDTDEDYDGTRSSRSLPAALTKRKHQPYRSWSEQSSVYRDATAIELDLLLDWWRSLEGWEKKPADGKGEERNFLILMGQKLKTAMRLYELLVFQRGTDLLNHITELHCTADRIIKSNKKAHIAKMTGGTAGAVGGVTIAAGLALAPLTFGASLLAAGAGVGVVAAGGIAGASATLTKKLRGTQLRNKVEKILKNYNSQMEDIRECLVFIDRGMERLRDQDQTDLKHMDQHLMKTIKAALELDRFGSPERVNETSCVLQSLDYYSNKDDRTGNEKNSDRKFAEKVHEVADKLKEEINELIRIKNLFRSITVQVQPESR